MNGILNGNQLTLVKENDFVERLIHNIDSIIDNCIRDCHAKFFHIFEYKCENGIKLTNIPNNETVNLTIADKNMNLCQKSKKIDNCEK